MIDDKNNFVNATAEPDFELPPPAHFDEVAKANAQPVKPLSRNLAAQRIQHTVQGAIRRAHSARQIFAGRGAALALVVICGLAAGAVAGTLLVTERRQSIAAPAAPAEPATALDAPQEVTKEVTQRADASSALPEGLPLPTVKKSKLRVRTVHNRSSAPRIRKAYRVAVIR